MTERPRERLHRLPRECYRGLVPVVYTACVVDQSPLFVDGKVVRSFVELLSRAVAKHSAIVPVYCFMPEHLHAMIQGQSLSSDTWQAMVDFKQLSGYWLQRHGSRVRWQKDFYDHIIRQAQDLGAQARYLVANPVRRGLVKDWREYPYTGAIGIDWQVVINSAITL